MPAGHIARSPDSKSDFSWWLAIIPGIGLLLTLGALYVSFSVMGEERRILADGSETDAQVVRVWQEQGRDSKGRQTVHRFASLAWSDSRGNPRTFPRLLIGKDAHDTLSRGVATGETRTRIRYDDANPASTPLLLADLAHRQSEWTLASWAVGGFGLFTLFGIWLFRRSWLTRNM